MTNSDWMVALPFWILGAPLIVALFAYTRPLKPGSFVPTDRRNQRSNIIGDAIIRAGDTVLFKG